MACTCCSRDNTPDLVQRLCAEHEFVKAILDKIEVASTAPAIVAALGELRDVARPHHASEERELLPQLERTGFKAEARRIRTDHARFDVLREKAIDFVILGDPRALSTARMLAAELRDHIALEEAVFAKLTV